MKKNPGRKYRRWLMFHDRSLRPDGSPFTRPSLAERRARTRRRQRAGAA